MRNRRAPPVREAAVVIFSRTLRLARRATGATIAAHVDASTAVPWFGS